MALIRMLGKGEPVSEQVLATALGVPESRIRETVGSWPGVFRDDDQRIIGFMGLSAVEFGDHRIEVDGRTLTAWGAWDTLFLPQLLGETTQVTLSLSDHRPTDLDDREQRRSARGAPG